MNETANTFAGPGPDAQFQAHLDQGEFKLQYCLDSDQFFFYPRAITPTSGSANWEWRDVSGRATVYSSTVIRRRAEKGGPYNLALIELAEGPRMMSRVEGIAPDAVSIGMSVKAKIVEQDGQAIVVFALEVAA